MMWMSKPRSKESEKDSTATTGAGASALVDDLLCDASDVAPECYPPCSELASSGRKRNRGMRGDA